MRVTSPQPVWLTIPPPTPSDELPEIVLSVIVVVFESSQIPLPTLSAMIDFVMVAVPKLNRIPPEPELPEITDPVTRTPLKEAEMPRAKKRVLTRMALPDNFRLFWAQRQPDRRCRFFKNLIIWMAGWIAMEREFPCL